MTIFILLFCVSGIILNHRSVVSNYVVSRDWLPGSYKITNFNNGVVKGSLKIDDNKILAYGSVGIWMTDSLFSKAVDFNSGLPSGVDGRNIRRIVKTKDGSMWCAAQFDLYKLNGNDWCKISLPGNTERMVDLALDKDSCGIVAMTRSSIYRQHEDLLFERVELPPSRMRDSKVSLFKSIWLLHSGELFGVAGRIVVDTIAVIISFLCLSGIILFVLPHSMSRTMKSAAKTAIMKWNLKWHNKIGYYTLLLTVVIAFSGMCLRPPLLIPFVIVKTQPLPGSSLDSDNMWHDKLRGIIFDDYSDCWIVGTSDGFFSVDKDFSGYSEPFLADKQPPVSPMGLTVFMKESRDTMLVGSFSGLYRWNIADGGIVDYMSGETYMPTARRGFAPGAFISGFSNDFNTEVPVVFNYNSGTDILSEMPEVIGMQPMSLWNFALELHVGRCYTPFLGPLSELYVFLSGMLLILILISGLIINNKRKFKTKIIK